MGTALRNFGHFSTYLPVLSCDEKNRKKWYEIQAIQQEQIKVIIVWGITSRIGKFTKSCRTIQFSTNQRKEISICIDLFSQVQISSHRTHVRRVRDKRRKALSFTLLVLNLLDRTRIQSSAVVTQ